MCTLYVVSACPFSLTVCLFLGPVRSFDYCVEQLMKLFKQNGLVQSEHQAGALTHLLKMKKHDRLDLHGRPVSSAEDLFRCLEGWDRRGLAEAYPGELDGALQAYAMQLSLFVQPLENRLAAKQMQRRQAPSTDSHGRERERDSGGRAGAERGGWRGEAPREKVLAADVLRLCRHQRDDVRCVIDRCLQLSKDSHLGRFVWCVASCPSCHRSCRLSVSRLVCSHHNVFQR